MFSLYADPSFQVLYYICVFMWQCGNDVDRGLETRKGPTREEKDLLKEGMRKVIESGAAGDRHEGWRGQSGGVGECKGTSGR